MKEQWKNAYPDKYYARAWNPHNEQYSVINVHVIFIKLNTKSFVKKLLKCFIKFYFYRRSNAGIQFRV